MSVIQNLYILPPEAPATPPAPVAEIVAALVGEGMLRGPAVVGPLWRPERGEDGERVPVEPQSAASAPEPALYAAGAARFGDLGSAARAFGAWSGPALLAVAAVEPSHPGIAREVDHYQGSEWALGAAHAPGGWRLRRHGEVFDFDEDGAPLGAPPLLIDVVIAEWIHLQGKCAPWPDHFEGGCMDRAISAFWPGRRLAEIPYF